MTLRSFRFNKPRIYKSLFLFKSVVCDEFYSHGCDLKYFRMDQSIISDLLKITDEEELWNAAEEYVQYDHIFSVIRLLQNSGLNPDLENEQFEKQLGCICEQYQRLGCVGEICPSIYCSEE